MILFISAKCKNVSAVLLISMAIFALPVMLYLAGAEFVLPLCMPFSVNWEIIENAWWYIRGYWDIEKALKFGYASNRKIHSLGPVQRQNSDYVRSVYHGFCIVTGIYIQLKRLKKFMQ